MTRQKTLNSKLIGTELTNVQCLIKWECEWETEKNIQHFFIFFHFCLAQENIKRRECVNVFVKSHSQTFSSWWLFVKWVMGREKQKKKEKELCPVQEVLC